MGARITLVSTHAGESEISSAPARAPEAADLLIAHLEQIGVEYVFGIPGGAIEPLYNALARSERRGKIRHILARHEAGAAFMADGYARESGKIGVCCATSGPGATNLITGIACAYDNNIPLLAITGLPALPNSGRGAFQESSDAGVNAVAMFDHCTCYNATISHPSQLEYELANALIAALRYSAPAHLAIPVDILRSTVPSGLPAYDLSSLILQPEGLVDEHALRLLQLELRLSRRTVVLIGASCGSAIGAILQLVQRTGAQFVTTPDAKGLVDPCHPAYCGVFGFGGHVSASALLADEPDLILAFGTGFGELNSGGWNKHLLNSRLVHVDNSPRHLMRSPMARLHVQGHLRPTCERLLELLDHDREAMLPPAPWRSTGIALQAPEACHSDAAPLKPQRLMLALSDRCPPKTRFIADMGNSLVWAIHYLQPKIQQPSLGANWFRIVMNFCPMGWSLGASIGTARANPASPVVCIVGDGSFLMSGQEISVAAEEGLSVLFVVLNDGALGMVRHGQRFAGAEAIAHDLPHVDFSQLASALGIPGHTVRSPQELDALDFDALLQRRGPTLLDVHIDPEEPPPMQVRMRTLGTARDRRSPQHPDTKGKSWAGSWEKRS